MIIPLVLLLNLWHLTPDSNTLLKALVKDFNDFLLQNSKASSHVSLPLASLLCWALLINSFPLKHLHLLSLDSMAAMIFNFFGFFCLFLLFVCLLLLLLSIWISFSIWRKLFFFFLVFWVVPFLYLETENAKHSFLSAPLAAKKWKRVQFLHSYIAALDFESESMMQTSEDYTELVPEHRTAEVACLWKFQIP